MGPARSCAVHHPATWDVSGRQGLRLPRPRGGEHSLVSSSPRPSQPLSRHSDESASQQSLPSTLINLRRVLASSRPSSLQVLAYCPLVSLFLGFYLTRIPACSPPVVL